MSRRLYFADRLMIAVLDEAMVGDCGDTCTLPSTCSTPSTNPCIDDPEGHIHEAGLNKAAMFDLTNVLHREFQNIEAQHRETLRDRGRALEELDRLDQLLKKAREHIQERRNKLLS